MSIKDINIKNRIYYFFNDIIYIENFGPNNIRNRSMVAQWEGQFQLFLRTFL